MELSLPALAALGNSRNSCFLIGLIGTRKRASHMHGVNVAPADMGHYREFVDYGSPSDKGPVPLLFDSSQDFGTIGGPHSFRERGRGQEGEMAMIPLHASRFAVGHLFTASSRTTVTSDIQLRFVVIACICVTAIIRSLFYLYHFLCRSKSSIEATRIIAIASDSRCMYVSCPSACRGRRTAERCSPCFIPQW